MNKATFVNEIPDEIKGNEVPTVELVQKMIPDTSNFAEKGHTHMVSEISGLEIPGVDTSNLAPKEHTHTSEDISDKITWFDPFPSLGYQFTSVEENDYCEVIEGRLVLKEFDEFDYKISFSDNVNVAHNMNIDQTILESPCIKYFPSGKLMLVVGEFKGRMCAMFLLIDPSVFFNKTDFCIFFESVSYKLAYSAKEIESNNQNQLITQDAVQGMIDQNIQEKCSIQVLDSYPPIDIGYDVSFEKHPEIPRAIRVIPEIISTEWSIAVLSIDGKQYSSLNQASQIDESTDHFKIHVSGRDIYIQAITNLDTSYRGTIAFTSGFKNSNPRETFLFIKSEEEPSDTQLMTYNAVKMYVEAILKEKKLIT